MRTLSTNFRTAMNAEDTGEIVVVLLTISHPDLPAGDLHLSSDTADLLDAEEQLRGTISRGQAYSFLPFTLTLPEAGEDAGEVINITVDNMTQQLTPLLRSTVTPASVTIELVLASAPDVIEVSYPNFELATAEVDATQVVLGLTVDAMAAEPFPADDFTPSTFGGLWSTT